MVDACLHIHIHTYIGLDVGIMETVIFGAMVKRN